MGKTTVVVICTLFIHDRTLVLEFHAPMYYEITVPKADIENGRLRVAVQSGP